MLDVVSAAWRLDCALLQHRRQTAGHVTDLTTSQPTSWNKIRLLTAAHPRFLPKIISHCLMVGHAVSHNCLNISDWKKKENIFICKTAQKHKNESWSVELPQLSCIAFRVPAEGLVWPRASGHRTRRGSWECRWWGLGNLLSKVTDPFLLFVLTQGQQEHVPGRGHIVIYCKGMAQG